MFLKFESTLGRPIAKFWIPSNDSACFDIVEELEIASRIKSNRIKRYTFSSCYNVAIGAKYASLTGYSRIGMLRNSRDFLKKHFQKSKNELCKSEDAPTTHKLIPSLGEWGAVTLHGRKVSSTPLIDNGDIYNYHDSSKASSIMIAGGALSNLDFHRN
ncbi:hypothetical protein ACTFIT_011111 [Dictyostelium discoideum]